MRKSLPAMLLFLLLLSLSATAQHWRREARRELRQAARYGVYGGGGCYSAAVAVPVMAGCYSSPVLAAGCYSAPVAAGCYSAQAGCYGASYATPQAVYSTVSEARILAPVNFNLPVISGGIYYP